MATQLTEKRDKPGPAKRDRTTPALFLRQVTAELRTYTIVALVFVLVMVVIVTSLDYAFTKLVFWAFG